MNYLTYPTTSVSKCRERSMHSLTVFRNAKNCCCGCGMKLMSVGCGLVLLLFGRYGFCGGGNLFFPVDSRAGLVLLMGVEFEELGRLVDGGFLQLVPDKAGWVFGTWTTESFYFMRLERRMPQWMMLTIE
jgi:hypothetical protein